MEDNRILSRGNFANSLQISILGNIDKDNFFIEDGYGGKEVFLIKNITEEPITTTVILAGDDNPIETVFYSGWNVELIKKVVTNVEGLQYGY